MKTSYLSGLSPTLRAFSRNTAASAASTPSVFAAVAFLGLVQGLTEFLPISSTGHLSALRLTLLYRFRTIEAWGLFGDLTLHLGTLMAALLYFLPDIWRDIGQLLGRNEREFSGTGQFWSAVLVCTGVTGLLGYFLHDRVEQSLRSPLQISVGFVVTALVLFLSRRLRGASGEIAWSPARVLVIGVVVGLAQTLALWPGVSRSGLTIVAALAMGMAPLAAFRFSFYTGIPLMAGAWLYDLWSGRSLDVGQFSPLVYLSGAGIAALSGWWALAWLQRWTEDRKLHRFGYYCLFVALALAVYAELG